MRWLLPLACVGAVLAVALVVSGPRMEGHRDQSQVPLAGVVASNTVRPVAESDAAQRGEGPQRSDVPDVPTMPAEAPTVTAAPSPEPALQASAPSTAAVISGYGKVTHYGESYEGGWLGCGRYTNLAGDNLYHTGDPTIVATRNDVWPCGQRFRITGPAGSIIAWRQDTCPGCAGRWHLDLSEAGNAAVCGSPPHTCNVQIEVIE